MVFLLGIFSYWPAMSLIQVVPKTCRNHGFTGIPTNCAPPKIFGMDDGTISKLILRIASTFSC